MSGGKLNVHPEHLRKSGGTLGSFGDSISASGQKLRTAGQSLVDHASGDKSGIGAVVAKAFGRGVEITGKVFDEGGRVVSAAGQRLHTTADLHEEADSHGAGLLGKIRPEDKAGSPTRGGGARAASRVGGGSGGGGLRGALSRVGGKARDLATGTATKVGRALGDPVDMVTGEVVQSYTDVQLPGALPLLLERTFASNYREGGWFGWAWASTFDQRIEIDAEGICFAAADGMLLFYPVPDGDAPVLPEEGPRWPLRRGVGAWTISLPDNGNTLHFPVSGGPLAAVVDRNGHRVDFTHDDSGAPVEVRHSGGYRIEVRTESGRITALRLPAADADLVAYRYDQAGNLAEVVNSSGLPMRFDYDAEGRVVRWEDRRGCWYRFTYDEQGRCVAGEGADGALNSTFVYGDETTVHTDSLGHTTTFRLNGRGQVVAVTDARGNTTRSEWDRFDRLLSRTDPLGRTTSYGYDTDGNITELVRPDGATTRAEYNALRQPIAVVEPDGGAWRWEYDERGNLTAAFDPTGAATRYSYTPQGNLATVTDALGNAHVVECDTAGQVVAVTDPLGGTTRSTRDAFGRVATFTDAAGGTTRYQWTVEGSPSWQELPDGSTQRWSYDGEGNPIEQVDALGQVTRTEFTHFDLPSVQIGPDGTRLEFFYDTELRLARVANHIGQIWQRDYDAAGNLVWEKDFGDRVLEYAYDEADQLTHRSNGLGELTSLSRDLLGNVVERRTGEQVTTFGYDVNGRVAHAANADVLLLFQRDPLGQVLAETCNGRTVFSTYDALGRRLTRVTPAGTQSGWEYDANDRPVLLRTAGRTLRFGYDQAGREVHRSLDAAVTLAQTWDPAGRLRTQAVTAQPLPGNGLQPQLVQRRSYQYRQDGGVTTIVDQLAGPRQFDLDAAGRVTTVTGNDWIERYRYDPTGDLVQDDTRLRHDAQGRVVTRQRKRLSAKPDTWHYEWDADDRLTAVTTPDGTRWRYRYDPFGRRVAKQQMAGDTVVLQIDFTWDGTVLAEQTARRPGGPEVATTWDYDPDTFRPLVQLEQSAVDQRFYAIVTDLVGTPTELVDPSGAIAWRSLGSLWGRVDVPPMGTAYTPLRFPGQYHDVESGLNYNYFRYYDPESAQYQSADPIGLLGGPNPHAYVPNPLTWLDPLGLKCARGEMEAMMRSQKIAPDLLDKGVHFNVNVKNKKFELRAAPTNEGGVVLKPVNPKMARDHPQLYQEALRKGQGALEYPEFRDWLGKHAEKGAEMAPTSSQSRHWGKVREFNGLRKALANY